MCIQSYRSKCPGRSGRIIIACYDVKKRSGAHVELLYGLRIYFSCEKQKDVSCDLFFLTNILSKCPIKEVKINYKTEKINPFQKEKR